MNLTAKLPGLITLAFCIAMTSCSDDDGSSKSVCLSDSFEMVETEVEDLPSAESVIITFDVTNNSSKDYDISDGKNILYTTIDVTTTDGTVYETESILPLESLSAGATASVSVMGTYGAGKTYESYEITLYCD